MADGGKADVGKIAVVAPIYPWYTIRKLQAVETVDRSFIYSLRKYVTQVEVIDIARVTNTLSYIYSNRKDELTWKQ